MTRTRINTLLATGVAAMFVVASCGSDDKATSDATTTLAESAATPAATDGPAAADPAGSTADSTDVDTVDAGGVAATGCEEWFAADSAVNGLVMGGRGDPESVNKALDAAIDATDPEISAQIAELKEMAQAAFANPEVQPPDELLALHSDTIARASEACGVPILDVTAFDYGYEGFPTALEAGYTVVNFENTGEEIHEMFMVRINDDTAESIDQLLELPEEEIFSKIVPVNAAFAPAGGSGIASFDLGAPGRYAIVCVIPVGSVGDAEGDGPPHFTQGMVQGFTVS